MNDDAKKAYIFTDTSTINLKARNFQLKGPCHEKSFLNENVGNISGGKDMSDWIFTILLCPCNFLRILNDGVVKVQQNSYWVSPGSGVNVSCRHWVVRKFAI